MKKLAAAIVVFFCLAPLSMAQDMRAFSQQVMQEREALQQAAREEKQRALREARLAEEKIQADRQTLVTALALLEKNIQDLKKQNLVLRQNDQSLARKEKDLESQNQALDRQMGELAGFVKKSAAKARTALSQSPQSALAPGREKGLAAIAEGDAFPSQADLESMVALLLDELQKSGEVRLEKGMVVDRAGREKQADILMLGNFTAAFQDGDEVGFLLYSEPSHRFFALSQAPGFRLSGQLKKYMQGKAPVVPMDISQGGALRQFAKKSGAMDQVEKGGPLIWPILGIFLLAGAIVVERLVYLVRTRVREDDLLESVSALGRAGKWGEARKQLEALSKKPVARVLLAGVKNQGSGRQDMENALQETILGEIPAMERFLSTLGMLAAISPLLGLLGTVTGMINTFQSITVYGTGDPRMLSGGISEALVTTMLGLMVAIPALFAHALLNRAVEARIGRMEEKAVGLVNTVFSMRSKEV